MDKTCEEVKEIQNRCTGLSPHVLQDHRREQEHCHTLLTCGLQRRQVPHGEHLTKKCRNWMVRREVELGWCPEVA